MVTTTSRAAASRASSAASAPVALQNSFRRAGVRHQATTRSMPGTAARMASTWPRACQPQPITPRLAASGFARYFAATPLAAPVRSRPSASASMTACSSGVRASKSSTQNREPSPKALYTLAPA